MNRLVIKLKKGDLEAKVPVMEYRYVTGRRLQQLEPTVGNGALTIDRGADLGCLEVVSSLHQDRDSGVIEALNAISASPAPNELEVDGENDAALEGLFGQASLERLEFNRSAEQRKTIFAYLLIEEYVPPSGLPAAKLDLSNLDDVAALSNLRDLADLIDDVSDLDPDALGRLSAMGSAIGAILSTIGNVRRLGSLLPLLEAVAGVAVAADSPSNRPVV